MKRFILICALLAASALHAHGRKPDHVVKILQCGNGAILVLTYGYTKNTYNGMPLRHVKGPGNWGMLGTDPYGTFYGMSSSMERGSYMVTVTPNWSGVPQEYLTCTETVPGAIQ